ncbi:MAG: gliding motility-associated C-terminal domain-containing protein [Bacteroidetes bacterium]|nr:MAG: gliding motility-associated C-terminal domain-containing protein [Bacteroidota bacterium]
MYLKKNTYCFFIILFFLVQIAFAQKEENIWIVDENYAADFNSSTPQVFKANFGRFHPQDHDYYGMTVSTICDKNGNLLFYTDGNQVWNAERQIMPNGQLANHNPNTLLNYFDNARAIIIPNLNNPNLYYIIVCDQVREINTYSVVDITLDGGKGDVVVTQKMIPFTNGNYFYDFRATGADSCRGIWLIGLAKNVPSKIFAFKIGADDISNTPIISSINNSINISFNDVNLISQDGTIFTVRNRDKFEILINKFNLKSGGFDFNPLKIFKFKNLTASGFNFSYVDAVFKAISNSSFYLSPSFDGNRSGLFMSNLFGANTSFNILTSNTGLNVRTNFARYAPNNKIYYSTHTAIDTGLPFPYTLSITSHNLAVINNPDGIGTNVGYDFNGITFPGDAFPRVPYQGLVNYYGKPKPRPHITLPTQVVCPQTPFTLSADVSNLPQVQSGKQIWYLNDTEIISFNPNDSYTIQEPGVYKLSFRHEECIEHTTITVTSPIVANVPPKDTICEGSALLLTALGTVFVSNVQNQPVSNPVSVAGVFTYTFGGCNTVSGGFELAQIQKPALHMPVSVLGCVPLAVVLNPSFSTSIGQNLKWSNGFVGQSQSLTTSGLYVLTISNSCFAETDSTQVQYYDVPKITQPTTDTTVCEGQKIAILATYPISATNELGNNTVATSLLGISKSGNYTLHAANACFTTTSYLSLKTDAVPRFIIPTDTIICDYTTANIVVIGNKNATTNVNWSDGTQENIRTISQAGEFEIEVKNSCGTFKKAFAISFAKSEAGFNGTNVFTPNGDGINDTWQPTTENTANYQLQIYNRYGTLVFETTTWNQAWNASASPDGLYYFHLSYTDCNQQTKSLKGTVMVVR